MSKNLLARRKVITARIPQAMNIIRNIPDAGTVAIVHSIRSLKELPVNGSKSRAEEVLAGITEGLEREEYRSPAIAISEYDCMYW